MHRIRIYKRDNRDELGNWLAGTHWEAEKPDGARPDAATGRVYEWTVPESELLIDRDFGVVGWDHEPRKGEYRLVEGGDA